MAESKLPKNYVQFRSRYRSVTGALDDLGRTLHEAGPVDEKNAQLIQLAAAASIHSEGAVHSHCRRALDAGASQDEIRHAIILLTSTLGFPTMMAALCWVEDILDDD